MSGFLWQLSFWVLAVVTVGSAFLVAILPNLSRAVVFLVFFFLGTGGLYFLLEAEFLALVQVMVYAGAVAILFAFVVMLTPGLPGEKVKQALNRPLSLALAAVFLLSLLLAVGQMPGAFSPAPAGGDVPLRVLGRELLVKFLLPFELVSVVLLVALVGAVLYTGRKEGEGSKDAPD